MPRGWYLAQGLIPLGYSSSDDDEGPCELPNGRLVCGPHGLVQCDLDDDEEDDEDHHLPPPRHEDEMVRGTGLVFPSKFQPPVSHLPPTELFRGRVRFMNMIRCTLPDDSSTLVLMTDGACLNNGQANPKAGWAFFQGLSTEGQPRVVSNALEKQGPWGDDAIQTSNRAELRAVIAALRFRYWPGEGFSTAVIATDSEYVVEGSTQWAKTWVRNGWKTRGQRGTDSVNVKNKDLWEVLLGECERAHRKGLTIQFWKIPREWNTLADEGAKKAAAEEEAPAKWTTVIGLAL
ncbi:hypothetical protein LMH87_010581 [Akanthomyces muscarius]|uniref:ribonuclease H n=1 Tax=Akanthomyces muscarius TaxID=2231603 RepID=A0A9W8QFT4_AKAMU|nr:hypothetical protein LMH87_010581 [Akanthomyces muscarius]KAJ4154118.1 hypothetical protein LMH87_010581 [Akanthomyces muscarius]